MTRLEGRVMRTSVVVAVGLFVLDAACIPVYRSSLKELSPGEPGFQEMVQVRFLGVGGFSIRRGEDVILTAPLYSNPSAQELDSRRNLTPKVDRIERFHPRIGGVKAILVGHAHYDHLMDVPYVWAKTPDATIYGNTSTKNILAGYAPGAAGGDVPRIPPGKVVSLDHAGENVVDYRMCLQNQGPAELVRSRSTEDPTGEWVRVPGANIRIRALCSAHPAQILSIIHLWPGCIHRPRFAPPTRSEDYQEGETLAYLIDFLGDDGLTPVFRIYYQDAPTAATIGQVPPALTAEKPVDLALLCVGNFFAVERPTHIVENTKAPYIILTHWEDFFRPQDQRLKGIPFAKVRRVLQEVEKAAPGAEVYVPAPQTVFHLRKRGAGVEMVGGRK
jgi:hypothetical protein